MNTSAARPGNYLAVSGGVGGAKLVLGLSRILAPENLVVVANTGDDFTHLGLRISPDLDTVMYTLAGLNDPEKGWGLTGETWQALGALRRLDAAHWFQLGDRDLGTHLARTELLRSGHSLSEVTAHLASRMDVVHPLFPMTDSVVETQVRIDSGDYLSFQHYFVRDRCEPRVTGFRFAGIDQASPSPGFKAALEDEGLAAVILCPSNPFVSVDPVLGLRGVRDLLRERGLPVLAVSPIVGGEALKGPAAKMMDELAMPRSAVSVAKHYQGLVSGFVMDLKDAALAQDVAALGMTVHVTQTVMRTLEDRVQLAREVLDFAHSLGAS